jgi:pimeloyl-ACP methyl ester carboxylesterase
VAASVVLVHGAWHGAWCYAPVVKGLEERGVEAIAVDLPGHGDSTEPLGDLHQDASAVRKAVDRAGGPVVLLGHSYGGMVVTEAGAHPNVRHLVYLCAFMPDAGESLETLVGSIDDPGLTPEKHMLPGEREGEARINPTFARELFYADASDEQVEHALARLVPEWGPGLGQAPAAIAWHDRPSTYVVCTNDRALIPALQFRMAPRATETVEWPTSHSPFLSRPDLVVDLLTSLASRYS